MRLAWFASVIVLVACQLASGGTIHLRGTARLDAGEAVTLGAIAELTGEDTKKLAGLIVVEDVSGAVGDRAWLEVTLSEVRSALRRQGVGLGRYALCGSKCVVRLRRPAGEEEAASEAAPQPKAELIVIDGPATVRTEVAQTLLRMFGVEQQRLRALFDDRDKELLDMAVAGRRVIVRSDSSSGSSRVKLDVRVMAGDQTLTARRIGVDVEIRRRVLVLGADVERHERVAGGTVQTVEMWMTPRGSSPLGDIAAVEGQRASRPLRAGSILRSGDVEPAIVVERGELVTVMCLNGGIGVQTRARAQTDGRVGERIECKLLGSKKTFVARVDGPGRVVLVLDGHDPGDAGTAYADERQTRKRGGG